MAQPVVIKVNGREWNINPIIWRPDGSYVVNLQDHIGYHVPNPATMDEFSAREWADLHAAIEKYINDHPGVLEYLDDWDLNNPHLKDVYPDDDVIIKGRPNE